jgi:hypothetical protein
VVAGIIGTSALLARSGEGGTTAIVLGTLTAVTVPYGAASDMATFDGSVAGTEIWAIATAVAVLWYGTYRNDRAVEGIGVAAVAVGVAVVVGDHLVDSEGASAVALVLGLALLGGSLLATRRGCGTGLIAPARAGSLPPPGCPDDHAKTVREWMLGIKG